jgi:N-carbamoylputrescine amidase
MAGIYHNSVLVIDENGHRVGVYRKTHIPHDPSFHEKYFFTPGDELTPIITLKGVKVAVLICWDQWFPEGARLAAIAGAELIIYPTAIGLLPEEQGTAEGEHIKDAWRTIQRGHAIANGCYVAAVNRVGTERSKERESDITFFGSSFCTGPMGELLATAAIDQEEIVLVDIHTAAIESTRRIWPFLRDRRVDLYGDITRRAIDELSK